MIADAHMGCYGQLHPCWSDGHRKDITRQAEIAKTRSNTLQASHARVNCVSLCEICPLRTHTNKRFYPGIGIPTVQLIGPGSTPSAVSAIDAPESMEAPAFSDQEQQEPVTSQSMQTRAPCVTGSFDHPVLPMPPVGIVCD